MTPCRTPPKDYSPVAVLMRENAHRYGDEVIWPATEKRPRKSMPWAEFVDMYCRQIAGRDVRECIGGNVVSLDDARKR